MSSVVSKLSVLPFAFLTNPFNSIGETIKRSKVTLLPVGHHEAHPLGPCGIPRHTFIPRRIPFTPPHILRVTKLCGIPEVFNPIVCGTIIDMVKACRGKMPINVKPSQSMSKVSFFTHIYSDMSCSSIGRTHLGTTVSPRSDRPELSRNSVIMKPPFQLFLSKIVSVFHTFQRLKASNGKWKPLLAFYRGASSSKSLA